MPLAAGARTESVVFSRLGAGVDSHGEEDGSWAELGRAKAAVIWGSGSEQRNAAREGGSQAATFVVLSTATTRGVAVKDQLTHKGVAWDITGKVERSRTEIEFNAVRSA